ISISSSELLTKANYQDFQRFQVTDISMVGDAEATLPALIEAVKSAIPAAKRGTIAQRGEAARKAHADDHARTRQAAALGWDASPISTARLCMETYNAVKALDWSIVSQSGNVSNWLNRLWPIEQHHHWIGRSGGFGVGYGAPASVGAALANRDAGRLSVNIQADGDLMYAPGVHEVTVRLDVDGEATRVAVGERRADRRGRAVADAEAARAPDPVVVLLDRPEAVQPIADIAGLRNDRPVER